MPRVPRKNTVVEMPQPDVSHSVPEITRDEIARRAYEIYTARGGAPTVTILTIGFRPNANSRKNLFVRRPDARIQHQRRGQAAPDNR
jgi:hypothetical protein